MKLAISILIASIIVWGVYAATVVILTKTLMGILP